MIKVLLVDDEQFIREGMRRLIDWESYGCRIAAEAKNGIDAIRILEEAEIDLVFVDIKMPGMGGMELISYVRDNISKRIRFVILTGYAEFDYARKALQMRVTDYILKPVQQEELTGLLKKISQENQKERREERRSYDFHISQILLGKFSAENIAAAELHLKNEEPEKYVSFEFDNYQKEFSVLSRKQRMEQQQQLVQYLQNLVDGHPYHVIPLIEAEEEFFGAGLLLSRSLYKTQYRGEEEYLEYLQRRIAQHFSCSVQVYIGQPARSLEELSQSFLSIRVARCLHGLAGEEPQVRNYEDYRHKKYSMGLRETDVELLLNAVKNNQASEIEECTERVFTQIKSSDMNMEMVTASVYYILYRLMEMVQEFDDETDQQEILYYIGKESFNKIALAGSTNEITAFFSDYAGYLAQVRSQKTRHILHKVDEYVQEHYMEKMSLKTLGELFHVNNVYLGQLYKKKYGIVFRDYLNNLRLEKAKELLCGTNLRIYAIAEQTGFGKAEYFINKFVQANHMTPNQYRIRNQKTTLGKEGE